MQPGLLVVAHRRRCLLLRVLRGIYHRVPLLLIGHSLHKMFQRVLSGHKYLPSVFGRPIRMSVLQLLIDLHLLPRWLLSGASQQHLYEMLVPAARMPAVQLIVRLPILRVWTLFGCGCHFGHVRELPKMHGISAQMHILFGPVDLYAVRDWVVLGSHAMPVLCVSDGGLCFVLIGNFLPAMLGRILPRYLNPRPGHLFSLLPRRMRDLPAIRPRQMRQMQLKILLQLLSLQLHTMSQLAPTGRMSGMLQLYYLYFV